MENALNDFRELLAVETAKIDRAIAEAHRASISFLAARGNLNSSGGMIKVTRDAAGTIPMHCQTAFTLLLRTLSAHGVKVDQSNKDAVTAILRAWTEERLLQLKRVVSITAPMRANSAQSESFLKEIGEAGDLEIRRIAGEISLIAASQGERSQINKVITWFSMARSALCKLVLVALASRISTLIKVRRKPSLQPSQRSMLWQRRTIARSATMCWSLWRTLSRNWRKRSRTLSN